MAKSSFQRKKTFFAVKITLSYLRKEDRLIKLLCFAGEQVRGLIPSASSLLLPLVLLHTKSPYGVSIQSKEKFFPIVDNSALYVNLSAIGLSLFSPFLSFRCMGSNTRKRRSYLIEHRRSGTGRRKVCAFSFQNFPHVERREDK